MANKVIVYTKPDCIQCTWTKRLLAKLGVTYIEADVSVDKNTAMQLGIKQLPFISVYHGDNQVDCWSGFKIEKIRGLNPDLYS